MSSSDDQLLAMIELDAKLDKIKSQINSKLQNQQQLAVVLSAIEDNLKEQKTKKTPVAYFVSFLSLLDQCCTDDDEIKDMNLATSALYFLDLVAPLTPPQLLKLKFSEILTKIAPAILNDKSEAPLLKSSIGVLETLLLVQDRDAWVNSDSFKISPKRGLIGLLEMSLDPRPKVRKRAQEAVNKVLITIPAGLSLEHPASGVCGEFALNSIIKLIEEQQKKSNKVSKELTGQIIHNLQLITAITNAKSWPMAQVTPLCDVLLELSKSSDQYLISSSFQAFEGLFQSMNSEIYSERFTNILNIIFELKPQLNDAHLVPSWLAVISKAIIAYSNNIDAYQCFLRFPEIFEIVGTYFKSDNENIRTSASQCLISVCVEGISDNLLLLPPKTKPEVYENVDDIITKLSEITLSFLNIEFRNSAKDICELISTVIMKFRFRANPDFIPHIEILGEWRSNEQDGFELNEVAETVISTAISSLGPEVVVGTLPLNLDKPNAVGRAWLLPLLRDNIRNASLSFYIKTILPYTEFFESRIANNKDPNSVHAKVFQTIVDQIWSLLPHFCDLPNDLQKSFTDEFAAKLSSLLYEKVELRGVICHALKLLVESNIVYGEGALSDDVLMQQQFPEEEAKKNIDYIATTKASKILSVLFNVFTQTPLDSRGFVLETIEAYLQISTPEDLGETFNKVCGILKKALEDESEGISRDEEETGSKIPRLSVTMMDIVSSMAKYVPQSSHNALFAIFNQTVKVNNGAIQKRSYRIVSRLLETEEGVKSTLNFISNITELLVSTSEDSLLPAKASRLGLILEIVKNLPSDQLHFIPSILSEIIISTKSVNEKTREESYQILIAMGHKMIEFEGSQIHNNLVPGMGEETPDSVASLQEFFTMCSAGLVGSTQHMVSAAITSISCLFYEFNKQMSQKLLVEINSTVELFLTSQSREIVKSTIGFVKVAVLTLPSELVLANIKNLLTNLMRWSHEHKGHFKSKVKHIIERMIRKFGLDVIEDNIPEGDKKLIANIRKSKARAKRKQQEETTEGSAKPESGDGKKFTSAYEEALYGESDSEPSDDEEEVESGRRGGRNNNRRGGKSEQYISESKDVPLDLLDRATLANISSSNPKKFTKKNLEHMASKFYKDGKLVIRDDEEDPLEGKDSVNMYVEAVRNGPTKGQKGKLKFKRGNSSREEDNKEFEEDSVLSKGPRGKFNGGRSNGGGRFNGGRSNGGKFNSRVGKPQQKFKARKKF